MELLQLVEKFKDVFSIEKIEDVVDELKSTLLNAENCRKLCEDWILICPDLTIDYMQMIFQYYFADRKEKNARLHTEKPCGSGCRVIKNQR